MIVTLPVSHLIRADDLPCVPGVQALEYRDTRKPFALDLPCLFHSGLGIVQDEFMDWLAASRHALADRSLALFSLDCGPAVREPRIEDYYYVSEGNPLSRENIKALIRSRLAVLRASVDTALAVENLNYFPTSAYDHVCEAGFISEVVCENDIGLVLDLAHAIISSINLRVGLEEYLRALPLDRVCAIHLSAPAFRNGCWRDAHGPPGTREYTILEQLLPCLPSDVYIAVEHYASTEALVEDYARLGEFLQERGILDDRTSDSAAHGHGHLRPALRTSRAGRYAPDGRVSERVDRRGPEA